MIKAFVHNGLRELWNKKTSAKIDKKLHSRILRRLDFLDVAANAGEMNIPGFDFHPLRGKPVRYSVHVNGPWCITFEFEGGDALRVNFEQYH
jgi:toxin HigB-1